MRLCLDSQVHRTLVIAAMLLTGPALGHAAAIEEQVAATPVGGFVSYSGDGIRLPPFMNGFVFTPTSDIEMTAIGLFDDQSRTSSSLGFQFVSLYESATRSLLAQHRIAGSSLFFLDDFRYVRIDPIVLRSGRSYEMVHLVDNFASLSTQSADDPVTPSEIGTLRFFVQRSESGRFEYPDDKGGGSVAWFGPNFLFRQVIPEPGSAALACLGLLAAGVCTPSRLACRSW